ncbi:YihY/virulence factor BrkB family protein [Herbiconiux sp. 11R-BC]|uniref:YihY/virulence factor BrkB family protein n=1 Tax=Herbiconiux sp. 11R-BC TaxID=3111637 RepID=UPI003C12A9DC
MSDVRQKAGAGAADGMPAKADGATAGTARRDSTVATGDAGGSATAVDAETKAGTRAVNTEAGTPQAGSRAAKAGTGGAGDDAASKPKTGIAKLIAWVMGLRPVRVFLRFGATGGELMASGMSFQAVFAIFAGIWVGFSIFGIVLAGNQDLMDAVVKQLSNAIPGLIGDGGALNPAALSQARIFGWTGAIALVGLVLTAVGWLATTRDAIRRIFHLEPPKTNFVLLKLKDFGLALGFGVAIVISSAVTLASSQGLSLVFSLAGVDNESPFALFAGQALGILIVFVFDTIVLALAFRVLSGVRIPLRRLVVGSAIGGAALGVLKFLGSALLGGATSNPLLASFAVIIGIMIFLNLVCRVILISATWIAVGLDDAGIDVRHLSPEELAAERERRVADARDVLVSAERARLEGELEGSKGFRRRRLTKELAKLGELEQAEAVRLQKR